MYLLLGVFFSTTSADCSCHSLWKKKKSGSLWNCNSSTMNSSSQDTVVFHCCLAQSAISLPCSLFASQVHHLTYVGIFKQFFSPEKFASSLEPWGFLQTSQDPSYSSLLSFFFMSVYLCPLRYVPLLYDESSCSVLCWPKPHWENTIFFLRRPPSLLYPKPPHLVSSISRVEIWISPTFFFFLLLHYILSFDQL